MFDDEMMGNSSSRVTNGGSGGGGTPRVKSPFEEFLRIIVRIFDYFCINEMSTTLSMSAPTALACAHHVHITDGIVNASDVVKSIDKLSRTAISYSFVYSGSDNTLTGSNISSSFGHLGNLFIDHKP